MTFESQGHELAHQAWQLIQHHLGVISTYMTPDFTEVMVNPDGIIWVDARAQGMLDTGHRLSPESRRMIIQAVASHSGQVCNRDQPQIDGILPVVKYRFSGLLEPASSAPAFTIRLSSPERTSLEEYVETGAVSPHQADLLRQAVYQRKNLLIVGGTGSGKTRFSNAVLDIISNTTHRVMTIEDTPELQCSARNHIPVFVNRQSAFKYRHALHSALRFRPDRIIVGELRDGVAALELLKAWNTGHSGGLATLHANNARSSLPRLEQLLEEEVARVPRALIAEAVDLIAFMERYSDSHSKQTKWRMRDLAEVHHELAPQTHAYQLRHHYHPSIQGEQ